MESYNNKMKGYIKEILSENPFFSSNPDTAKNAFDDFSESGFKIKPNLEKESDFADIFNYDFYAEILESIYKDIYYEKKLNQWIESKNSLINSKLPKVNSTEAKDAFIESFQHLIDNWHKFTPRSKGTDSIVHKYKDETINVPFSIFKAIYKRCPQLCVSAFPVIIFIIADSFYDFCKIAYTGKKHLLPKELSPQQEEKIYDLFHKIVTEDHKTYYLLSLLNSKGIAYTESSFDIGKEIHTLVLDEYKKHEKGITEFIRACEICNCEDPAEYAVQHPEFICESDICALDKCYQDKCATDKKDPKDCDMNDCESKEMYVRFHALMGASAIIDDWSDEEIIMSGISKLKKRFSDNLKEKQEKRKERSSAFPTEIMVGENYLAFLNFLKTQPDNCWKKGIDKATSLYLINHITGWLALHLLYRTCPPADWDYGLSLFNIRHLHTLYFIYAQIDLAPHSKNIHDGESHAEESAYEETNQPCAWVKRLLSDAQKMYQTVFENFSDNNSNVMFGDNSAYLLDNRFIKVLDLEHWFSHDRLAGAFTHYTYTQYMNSIPISITNVK